MSDFRFFCPECGQKIVCDAQLIGSRIPCPTCQKTVAVLAAFSLPPEPKIVRATPTVTVAEPLLLAPETSIPSAASPRPVPTAAPAAPPPIRTISPPLPDRIIEPEIKPSRPVVEVNRYSRLAIASLICSVFVPFGFIPGLICGRMAKKRMQKDLFLEGEKMANAGLFISYCMLGIVGLCGIAAFVVRGYQPRTLASLDTWSASHKTTVMFLLSAQGSLLFCAVAAVVWMTRKRDA